MLKFITDLLQCSRMTEFRVQVNVYLSDLLVFATAVAVGR